MDPVFEPPCKHGAAAASLAVHDCHTSGPKIHALVIGVSEYYPPDEGVTGRTRLSRLPGAAAAASRFVRYLVNDFKDPVGRCLGTVRLLASPLAGFEADEIARWVSQDATSKTAGKALQAWANDCDENPGNLGIVYLAGHGLGAVDVGVSVFYLADAMQWGSIGQASINVLKVVQQMGRCAANENYWFFDCCATVEPSLQNVDSGHQLNVEEFRGGALRSSSVTVSAARVGTAAYALGPEGTLLSLGLLGGSPQGLDDSALMVTSGEIDASSSIYGIGVNRLHRDLAPTLKSLLFRRSRNAPLGFEPSARGLLPHHISLVGKRPVFSIALAGLAGAPSRPVSMKLKCRATGEIFEATTTEDSLTVQLPAGTYDCRFKDDAAQPLTIVADRSRDERDPVKVEPGGPEW